MTRLPLLAAAGAMLAALFAVPGPTASGQQPIRDDIALITLKFRGGTAADYVTAVGAAGETVNILVEPGLDEVPMPPIELSRVSIATALELLEGRTFETSNGLIRIDVRTVRNNPLETQTYHLRPQVLGARRGPEAAVLSISAIIENGISADDVMAAVKLAVEVAATPTRADIRFHKETGLVIARGDERQLNAIEEVIHRLTVSVAQKPSGIDERALHESLLRVDQLAARVAQLELSLRERNQELTVTRRRLQDTQVLLNAAREQRDGS